MERLTRKDKCKLSHGEEIIICNHEKTARFIESGYDMEALKK